jgi:hypothetical protein
LDSTKPHDTLPLSDNRDFDTQKIDVASAPPASLYKTTKPAWFGDRTWPPIDPAANPKGITSTVIPAGYRFVNGTQPPGAVN